MKKKWFIWVYNSRGIKVHYGGEVWQQAAGQSRMLRTCIWTTSWNQRKQTGNVWCIETWKSVPKATLLSRQSPPAAPPAVDQISKCQSLWETFSFKPPHSSCVALGRPWLWLVLGFSIDLCRTQETALDLAFETFSLKYLASHWNSRPGSPFISFYFFGLSFPTSLPVSLFLLPSSCAGHSSVVQLLSCSFPTLLLWTKTFSLPCPWSLFLLL